MPVKRIRLVIVGGCLGSGNRQVPLNSVYHRIVARELGQATGNPVRVHLGKLLSHQPTNILAEVRRSLERHSPDGLLFQLRPDFLAGLFGMFWCTRAGRGLARLRINPHVAHRAGWPDDYESSMYLLGRFQRANLRLGRIAGTERRGLRILRTLIQSIRDACEERGARLFLLGPVFPGWYHRSLRDFTGSRVIPAIEPQLGDCIHLMDADWHDDPGCWVGDGLHVNSRGHREIAGLVTTGLLPWAMAMDTSAHTPGPANPRRHPSKSSLRC